jgi:Rha family phage regulatory protein
MVNELILSNFGVTEKKGIPVVSSRYVAKNFNKNHDDVLKSIRSIIEGLRKLSESEIGQSNFNRHNFTPTTYKNEQNKKQPEYLLTRDGFTLLAFGFSGEKALRFKIEYINAFNQMESFIKNLVEAKADFPEFTDAILSAHEEPKHFHFSNELNMINQIVTGMTAKKFKEVHGLENVSSIRPYLTPQQLEAVKALQRIDIGLIYTVKEYEKRKTILERQYVRLGQKQLSA